MYGNEKGIEFISKQELITAWNSLAKDNIGKIFYFLESNPLILFLLIKKLLTLFHNEIIKNIQSIYNKLSSIFKYKQDDINPHIKTTKTLEKVMKPMLKEYHKDIFLNKKQSEIDSIKIIDQIKSFYQNDPIIKPYITKDIKQQLNNIFTIQNSNLLNMFDNLTKIFLFIELNEPKLCICLPEKLQYQLLPKQSESLNNKIIPIFPYNKTSKEYSVIIPPPQFKSNQFIYASFQPIVYIKPKTQVQSIYNNHQVKNKIRLAIFDRINHNNGNNIYMNVFSTRISKLTKHNNINNKNELIKNPFVKPNNNSYCKNEMCTSCKESSMEKTKIINKRHFNYDMKLTSYSRPQSNKKAKNGLTISTEFEYSNIFQNKRKNGRNNYTIKNNTDENNMSSTIPHNCLSKVHSKKKFANVEKTEKRKVGLKNGISLYKNYCFKKRYNYITRLKYNTRLNKKVNQAQSVKTSLSNPNLKKILHSHLFYNANHTISMIHSKQENSNAFTSRSNAGS